MEWREFKMLYSSYNPIKYYPSNFTRKRPGSKEYNILAEKNQRSKESKKITKKQANRGPILVPVLLCR